MKQKKIKIAVIVLACLLGVSLLSLGGVLISRWLAPAEPVQVVVPDNVITPDPETKDDDNRDNNGNGAVPAVTEEAPQETEEKGSVANAVYLHRKNSDDNQPFQVTNLFPGDVETRYFCVRVSHKATVTLRFHADIRPGSEALAEVLMCRIVRMDTGDVLYEGLMRDMPASLNRTLWASGSTTTETYYEITAALDTSVGNAYQNQELTADFRWWVEEVNHLEAPKTGDIGLWPSAITAGVSLFFLLILAKKIRKEDEEHAK